MSTDNLDPARVLASIDRLLSAVEPLRGRLERLNFAGVAKGSPAARDQRSPLGNLPLACASQAIMAASEHALAWRIIRDANYAPTWSHLTLMRGALEGAVIARWMLAAPTPVGRISRAAGLVEQDLEERSKFEASFKVDTAPRQPPAMSGAERLVEHRERCREAGIQAKRYSSMSDLVRDHAVQNDLPHLRTDWLYRILSAVAHATPWSIVALRVEEVFDVGVPDTSTVKVAWNPLVTFAATRIPIDTLEAAADEIDRYVGLR
jgi:hypothetical protein